MKNQFTIYKARHLNKNNENIFKKDLDQYAAMQHIVYIIESMLWWSTNSALPHPSTSVAAVVTVFAI